MFAVEAATSSNGMSQKTYEIGFSFPCELRAERLSRKNGRGTFWQQHKNAVIPSQCAHWRGNLPNGGDCHTSDIGHWFAMTRLL